MQKRNERLAITKLNLAEKYKRLSDCANSNRKKVSLRRKSKRYCNQMIEMSYLFFRKLWHPEMIERWKSCKYTSQHHHGEPPEWIKRRQQGKPKVSDYPLVTHFGYGKASLKARKRYHTLCVDDRIPWEAVSKTDKWIILEQAGVFAYQTPADAYWYSSPASDTDEFAVFRGISLRPGPEERSLIAKVTKPIALFSREEFVNEYLNGREPTQPVNDLRIEHNPQPTELNEGDEDQNDYGEIPILR